MRGCILVHGLGGTPANVGSVRDKLLGAGYKVVSPCLAGHGGSVNDLSSITWHDWYDTVKTAYMELRRSVEKVYYVGLSMGSLLGIKLALDEGWGIRALALLSPSFKLTRLNQYLVIPLVRYTPLRFVVRSVKKNFEKAVSDLEGRVIFEATSLPRYSGKAVYELRDLQEFLIKDLKKVTNPTLIIHSRNDLITPLSNVDLVKRNIGSGIIETEILNDSTHIITLGKDKEFVGDRVVKFFDKF